MNQKLKKWACLVCGYIYDPVQGDPSSGVPPGTPFENLPEDWVCPHCGARKEFFELVAEEEAPAAAIGAERFIIIGNGIAGVTAGQVIVEKRPGAQIEIFAAESHPYYPRPPLPRFLAGEVQQHELFFYSEAWYQTRGITVHLGTPVVAIDPAGSQIRLANNASVPYNRLLLAMGGSPAIPPLERASLQGVFTLRTIDDTLAIRRYAEGKKKAVVIGGGLLGLEAGRGLMALGLQVTVIEVASYLLPRQLDKEGATVLQSQVTALGMTVLTGVIPQAILGTEQVAGVELKGNGKLDTDLVLISAGIKSNVQLAQTAGLRVNRGVIADEHLQTSTLGIYAAGDVAEFNGTVYGIIPAALEQSRIAAAHMTGDTAVTYNGTVPMTTLKIIGIDLTSMGLVNPQEGGYEELRFADERKGLYKKFVVKDGKVQGAILIGYRKDVPAVTRLINQRVEVANVKDRLVDSDFDLKSLTQ